MNKPYKRPILSGVFDILGALFLIVAGLTLVGGLRGESYLIFPAAAGLAVAIFYFGIAQVIDFLGRSAHNSERLCELIERNIEPQIGRLSERLSSGAPLLVRMDRVAIAAPSASRRGGAAYYHAADGNEVGPFTALDMKEFRAVGVLNDATQVFREGDTQWQKFRDFPELA